MKLRLRNAAHGRHAPVVGSRRKLGRRLHKACALLTAVAMLLPTVSGGSPSMAWAAPVYWDGGDTTDVNSLLPEMGLGGTGLWNTEIDNWWAGAGPNVTWSNANLDTAVFLGWPGSVALSAPITVGGLQFNTTGFTITADAENPLSFGGAESRITLSNSAAASIAGSVDGTANVTIDGGIYGGQRAGVLTLSGVSTGGWSGTTTLGVGMTLKLTESNQALRNTTAINLFGGSIHLLNSGPEEAALDRVAAAPINVHGQSSIIYENPTVGTGPFNETLGALNLIAGQLSVQNVNIAPAGVNQTLTLGAGSLSHAAGNTSTAIFLGGSQIGQSVRNRIMVSGFGATAGGSIIGPWAAAGLGAANVALDYAVYGTHGIARLGAATVADDSTWNTSWENNATGNIAFGTSVAGSVTALTANRVLNTLRHTGEVETLDLNGYQLQLQGLLQGINRAFTITNSGTGGGSITAAGFPDYTIFVGVSNNQGLTISAPIVDNGSNPVTLVKYGSTTLSLLAPPSGASNYSGGTVLNAGILSIDADARLGATTGDVTFDGNAELRTLANAAVTFHADRTFTINNALATISGAQGALPRINGPIVGSGGLILNVNNANGTRAFILANTNNTFAGPLRVGTLSGITMVEVASLADSATANGLIRIGGEQNIDTANTGTAGFRWSNLAQTSLTLDHRQFDLANNTLTNNVIENANINPDRFLRINTDLLVSVPGNKLLTLQGVNTGANAFVGLIADQGGSVISLGKSGAGTWSLPGANAYSGGTTITQGVLKIGTDQSLGSGTITLAGGTLDNSDGHRSLNNQVILSGNSMLQGAGDFHFRRDLFPTGADRVLTINTAGHVTFGDDESNLFVLSDIDVAQSLTLDVAATAAVTIRSIVYDGIGAGADTLVKTGSGSLTLNAANLYSGGTTLAGGSLVVGNDAALGAGALTATATSTIRTDGTARTLANDLHFDSTMPLTFTLGGVADLSFVRNIFHSGGDHALHIANSATTVLGDAATDTLTLAEADEARTLTLDVDATAALVIGAAIVDGAGTGADGWIKTGLGSLTLQATSTYTGATQLRAGLTVAAGGGANRLSAASALTLGFGADAAVLQLGDAAGASDQTVASLASAGTATSSAIVGGHSTRSNLTIDQAIDTTYAGNLGGSGTNDNNLNFIKSGGGELILAGTSSYVGTTTVNGGKLSIAAATAFPALSTSLVVGDGAEFALRGTSTTANVIYGFSGSGNVVNVGSATGGTLGFGLDGAFNTQLKLLAGQSMFINGTLTTAVYVNNVPIAGNQYVLIDGADAHSLGAGPGTFSFAPVVFNGGSFSYSLARGSGVNGGGLDQWILTATAQPAPAEVWWKGDLAGLGAGVWSASAAAGTGSPTNWDDAETGGGDTLVPPDSGSIVHFSATGATNFETTLGANLTIQELRFHAGATPISIGGPHTLTIGNAVDAAGLALLAGAPDVTFTAALALGQAQSFNIADALARLTLAGGLGGIGDWNINDDGASSGTIVLTGAAGLATYSGATNLAAGTLILEGGANDRLPTTTALTMGGAATGAQLQLGDALNGPTATTVGSLHSGTTTTNSIVGGAPTNSVLTITQTTAGIFRGTIGGVAANANNLALEKQGAAPLTLDGVNTYVGPTTVSNGILQLGGAGSLGGTASLQVIASPGATATFDVNGRTATLAGGITLGGADAAATARIADTATGGLIVLAGNVVYDATSNPLGSVIDANLSSSAAVTFLVGDSTSTTQELTLNGTYSATASAVLDGDGHGVINADWTLTGSGLAMSKTGTGTWTINAATSPTQNWVVHSGTINALASNALNAGNNLIIDGLGTPGSAIVNIDGTAGTEGVHQGNSLAIRNGGIINVYVNNGISTGTNTLLVGDSASTSSDAAGVLNLAASINPTVLQVGASGQIGVVLGAGTITSNAYSLRNGSLAAGISLGGVGNLTKVGDGTVTFAGSFTSTGNTNIQDGTLILDYTTNNSGKIGGVLSLGATQAALSSTIGLRLNGNESTATVQSVASTTILPGATTIEINHGAEQSAELRLGAITRTLTGGTAAFHYSSSQSSATTTSNLGQTLGWATVTTTGTTRVAAVDATGKIVQAASVAQSDVAAWTTGQNILVDNVIAGTVEHRNSIGALIFDAAADNTLTIGADRRLTLSSGAIIVSPEVGAHAVTISGGSLAGATTGVVGELIVHQFNAAGTLTIASNLSNVSGVTKSGNGTLVLTGDNSFTGSSRVTINAGVVRVGGGKAIGDDTAVLIRNGATLDIGATTETIGRLGTNANNISGGTISVAAGGALTVNQTANGGFAGVFSGAGSITKIGAGVLSLTGNSNGQFSGTLSINQGRIIVEGASGQLGTSTIILNGGELIDDQDQNGAVNRIANAAVITLNNTATGVGFYLQSNQNGTLTETVGRLTLGAGHNTVVASGTNANGVVDLLFTNFTRTGRATSIVRGLNLGSTLAQRGQIRFTNTPTGLVGGNAAAGSTTLKIFPYFVGDATLDGLGNSFVTLGASNNLRPLAANEYVADAAGFNALSGATAHNVRFAADPDGALTGTPTAINSLVFDSATAITASGSAALEITSGAVLAAGAGAHVLNGFAALTTGEGLDYTFYVTAADGSLSVGSPLTSDVPLVKSGAGTLQLTSASNAFTDIYLNQGIVLVDDLDKLGDGTLSFFGGGIKLDAGFTDDLSEKSIDVNTGGGTIDVSLVAAGATFAEGFKDSTPSVDDRLTIVTRGANAESTGLLTVQGTSTFIGTTVFNHGSVNSGVVNSVVLNGDTNAAIAGDVQIGHLTAQNTFDVVVALGASEQIADRSVVSFQGAGNSNSYFKLMGYTETVAGINDTTRTGVIENLENTESVGTDGKLIVAGSGDYSFSGYLRNRGGGANATVLHFEKAGVGTQTLSGNRISYTGHTDVIGGTLRLADATVFNSDVTNDATLELSQTSGVWTFANTIDGNGDVNKTGAGIVALSGNNTYAGATNVKAGTLTVNGAIAGTGVVVAPHAALNGGTAGAPAAVNTSVVVGPGGKFSAGSSTNAVAVAEHDGNGVGQLNVNGDLTWSAESIITFDFATNGTVGVEGTDWDLIQVGGVLNLEGGAGAIRLNIDSWLADRSAYGKNEGTNAALPGDFDPTASDYSWLWVTTAGGFTGVTSDPSHLDNFVFVTDSAGSGVFTNYTPAGGNFWVSQLGNNLYLNYSAVPEPGSIVLMLVAALATAYRYRRSPKFIAVRAQLRSLSRRLLFGH